MREYIKKGSLSALLMLVMLFTVCVNDTLYASTKRVDHLEVEYTGDELNVGDEVKAIDFRVYAIYEDETKDLLGTREFDLVLSSDSLKIEDTDDYAIVSYGTKWRRCELPIVGSGYTESEITKKKLLYITAKYEGEPVSVGGMASKRDFTVTATYRVYYSDNSIGRITEEVEEGWILLAHEITSGENDLTITYTDKNGDKASCTVIVQSSGTDGHWVKDGDAWKYRYDDMTYLIGDWIKSGGKWYYMDEYGYMMNRCMAELNGETYYFDETGAMQTGWLYYKRNWYYFNQEGKMQTGWIHIGGYWYYLDNDGIMLKEWKYLDGKWYFFNDDGQMQTGWLHRSYTWFFLDADGVMRTGWVYTGGKWYFMDHGGAMLTNTWVGNYFVDGSGAWAQTR